MAQLAMGVPEHDNSGTPLYQGNKLKEINN
jgi:hypothetical protein